jgi:hypothetical protein
MTYPWPDCLTLPAAFLAALKGLVARRRRGALEQLAGGDLALGAIRASPEAYCHALARDVARGRFTPGTAEVQRAFLGGRQRELCRLSLPDLLLHSVAARGLALRLERELSDGVFSYRPGRSAVRAARRLARHISSARRAAGDPRRYGLYLLRRDVQHFGESIPLAQGAPLWPMLHALACDGAATAERHWPLLQAALRAPRRDGEQAERSPLRGIPTGSPLQPVVANLYLGPLDRALDAIEGGLYLRYGDDLLFAHGDPDVVADASATVDEQLSALGLQVNRAKARDLYLTAAGRPPPRSVPFQPSPRVELLGLAVSGDGGVSPRPDKLRRLRRELRRRAHNVVRAAGDVPFEQRARALCTALNLALGTDQTLACALAPLLGAATDDRGVLRALDHAVALVAAEALSGQRGVRAFRRVSYRALRREHGLRSLIVRRNQRGRRGEMT